MNVAVGVPNLPTYPQGGGHWSWALQYLLGLRDLGHGVCSVECLVSSGNADADERRIRTHLGLLEKNRLSDGACVIVLPRDRSLPLGNNKLYSTRYRSIAELASATDVLLNLACAIEPPLLQLFPYRVLLDVDPGHLQISALTWDMGIHEHHRWFTVGRNLATDRSTAPTLGLEWKAHFPVVYLPMWPADIRTLDPSSSVSSVTHWNWEELVYDGKRIHLGKREAYRRYLDLPARTGTPFELAVALPDDLPAERQTLDQAGWAIVDPWRELGSPEAYRAFIQRSRAELCCAKEVYRVLNTGWISDRSAAYMAVGRPVIADDTGLAGNIEIGRGLFAVRSVEEAESAIAEINGNYEAHSRAARELAVAHFDSRRVLREILGD